jgi:hypothetical protein
MSTGPYLVDTTVMARAGRVSLRRQTEHGRLRIQHVPRSWIRLSFREFHSWSGRLGSIHQRAYQRLQRTGFVVTFTNPFGLGRVLENRPGRAGFLHLALRKRVAGPNHKSWWLSLRWRWRVLRWRVPSGKFSCRICGRGLLFPVIFHRVLSLWGRFFERSQRMTPCQRQKVLLL